jgi:hypothetical protein
MNQPDENMPAHDQAAEQSADMAERVEDKRRQGSISNARAAFSRSWREAVPELPLRFSVILVHTDEKNILRLAKRLGRQSSTPPKLKLIRRHEGYIDVLTSGNVILGRLPSADSQLLRELGPAAKSYEPQLIEIRNTPEEGLDYIAIELVRPELKYCSSCGKQHDGAHVNCQECRQKRRRRGPEQVESSPIAFHEALEAIIDEDSAEDLPL